MVDYWIYNLPFKNSHLQMSLRASAPEFKSCLIYQAGDYNPIESKYHEKFANLNMKEVFLNTRERELLNIQNSLITREKDIEIKRLEVFKREKDLKLKEEKIEVDRINMLKNVDDFCKEKTDKMDFQEKRILELSTELSEQQFWDTKLFAKSKREFDENKIRFCSEIEKLETEISLLNKKKRDAEDQYNDFQKQQKIEYEFLKYSKDRNDKGKKLKTIRENRKGR